MAEQQNQAHALTLDGRSKLTMTGVTEVVSFDDTSVVVSTPLGNLVVQGQALQLKTLDGGNVAVQGQIATLCYEEPRPTGSWLSRLIR